MVVKNNLCCASLKDILREMVVHQFFKALLHGAIFLATCIAIVLLGDVKFRIKRDLPGS